MPRARDEKSKYGRIADSRQARHMRLAILGGGTIARLVMETLRKGTLPGVEVLAIAGRSARSGGAALAAEYGARYVVGADALLAAKPEVVLEAASHDAVRAHLVAMLASGTSVIVLSGSRARCSTCHRGASAGSTP
jgi:predicted dinucleotide-utilizing enzyme